MTNEYPPLDLNDIVHIMSLSPAPPSAILDDHSVLLRPPSASPESPKDVSLQENNMNIIFTQDIDGRVNDSADTQISTVFPDHAQIIRQAEVISCLIEQRDMLVQQAEEQRLRWNSEKDGWARMAEALIAQQAKHRDVADKDEDLERQRALTEADNRNLRQRLHEAQSRLSILEGELSRLRPLLLMQPLVSNGPTAPTQTPRIPPHLRRRKDANTHTLTTEDEDPVDDSEDDHLAVPEDTPMPAQTTPTQKSHTASLHPHPHKRRRFQKHPPRVLTADARTEHLLLAAKRIGRQRVGIMAGLTQSLDRRRDESTSTIVATPKTPKRTAAVPPGPGYVYLNSPMRPGAVPVLVPAYPHHLLQTPSSSKTAVSASSSVQQKQQGSRNQNTPTPLDSLLNAARSMMDDGEDDEETLTGTRRSRSSDVPDSPIPKRRKVVPQDKVSALRDGAIDQGAPQPSSSSALAGFGSTAAIGRVRSGLDVLADQAAAFSSQDQQSHLEPQSRVKGKGKEKTSTYLDKSQAQTQLREKGKSRKQSVPDVISKHPQSLRTSPLTRATTVTDWGAGPPSLRPVQWTEGPTHISSGDNSTCGIVPPPNPPETTSPPPVRPDLVDQVLHDPPNSVAAPSPTPPTEPSSPGVDAPFTHSISNDPFLVPPTSLYESSSTIEATASSSALHQRAATTPNSSNCGDAPLDSQAHLRHETAPGSTNAGDTSLVAGSTESGPGPITETGSAAVMKNKARVADQDGPKRQRSPYVKWSKEEDDLLAQAVAKYGQKWDLVQKALPSRGYHQVRQRWLRRLGLFDSKPDLSAFHTGSFPPGLHLGETPSSPSPAEPPPNPKLGLAPLSSELAISSFLSGRGESRSS